MAPLHSRIHLPALDGLRGIAVLLVVVFHSFIYGGLRPAVAVDHFVVSLGRSGWVGVDLFFVLSGFLITGILLDAKGSPGYFRNFYMRRILRIFPLYYGFLFLVIVALPALTPLGRDPLLTKDQIWYWTYLTNAYFSILGEPPTQALGHLWSLAVEEQFYLVWPVVVLVLGRRALKALCLGLVGWSLAARVAIWATVAHPVYPAYTLTPARMDALAVGAFVALIAREPGGPAWLAAWIRRAAVPAVVLLGGIFIRTHLSPRNVVAQTAGITLLAIAFGSTLAAALTSPPGGIATRLFTYPALRFLGRYSYGVYVVHVPIIWHLRDVLNAHSLPAVAGSLLPGQLLFTAAAAALSLGAAMVSWHLYESRFLKLKVLFR